MMAEQTKERAVIFSPSERTIIMSLYEDNKHIIMTKSNTTARARQAAWQKIADKLNTYFGKMYRLIFSAFLPQSIRSLNMPAGSRLNGN